MNRNVLLTLVLLSQAMFVSAATPAASAVSAKKIHPCTESKMGCGQVMVVPGADEPGIMPSGSKKPIVTKKAQVKPAAAARQPQLDKIVAPK